MHYVSVGESHQNIKRITAVVALSIDFSKRKANTVWDSENNCCMFYSFEECPGKEIIKKIYLRKKKMMM